MNLYRKPDLFYVYEYDRITIKALKELEQELQISEMDLKHPFGKNSSYFREKAVHFAQGKKGWISDQIMLDERKDRLLVQNPVPESISCNTCGETMISISHLFRNNDTEVIYIFGCSKNHLPNKAVYSNGRGYIFPTRRCDYCGHHINVSEEKKGDILHFTDTCNGCGKVTSWDLDMNLELEPHKPVTDEDRQKYCTNYIGQQTFEQSLLAITQFIDRNDIQLTNLDKTKEKFDINDIEHLSIPQLEKRLIGKTEEAGYIKFQFERPQIGTYVIITFSLQDPTNRGKNESEKVLLKLLKKELVTTNWRLMATGVDYRLGFLTGKIKGYERANDLKRIAQEISKYK